MTSTRYLLLAGLLAGCNSEQTTLPAHSGMHGDAVTLPNSALADLRRVTDKYHDLNLALRDGYAIFGGCFADSVLGGMGQHYANDAIINDPTVKATEPELLLYETGPTGRPRLVAVEYIVFQAAWDANHASPPQLFGETFGLNTTLLPEPFYLLHAWAWKPNPSGTFANWNPRVSCS